MAGVCEECGLCRPRMKRCVRCRGVMYCSKDCQEKHWLTHKLQCSEVPETKERAHLPEGIDKDDRNNSEKQEQANHFVIKMKNKHGKSEVRVPKCESGEEMFLFLCQHLKTPPEKIRLISRGKLITKENISSYVVDGAIFQAFGEEAEDETGLDVRDIEVLMAQLSVERNVAIKALRRTGDLIDAFLYVSDNQ
ncbi:unnamed protein product [Staurois parvus]|uniref:MYND-type domain-containing protein n=1 Tax=Staurois parvus TaxID=386267 RepID=A0ABN9FLD8_9NEOB|nr:unnamed protein product [Staurois parvus]